MAVIWPDPGVTGEDLREYVGAGETKAEFAQQCVDEADALCLSYVGMVRLSVTLPDTIYARAVLNVAAELYYQKDAPGGIRTDFSDVQATSVPRLTRNPMRAAYPLLDPFLLGGFA